VNLEFLDSNPSAELTGQGQEAAMFSYFKGPSSDWKTGISAFSGIVYHDLWHGIDLVYGRRDNRLKPDQSISSKPCRLCSA
jgi:hypothetical protein